MRRGKALDLGHRDLVPKAGLARGYDPLKEPDRFASTDLGATSHLSFIPVLPADRIDRSRTWSRDPREKTSETKNEITKPRGMRVANDGANGEKAYARRASIAKSMTALRVTSDSIEKLLDA